VKKRRFFTAMWIIFLFLDKKDGRSCRAKGPPENCDFLTLPALWTSGLLNWEDLIMRCVIFLYMCVFSVCSLQAEEMIPNQGPELELLIHEKEIVRRIHSVAALLDKEYEGEHLTIVMIMKGAICVGSELMKSLKTPLSLEYIRAKSNGSRTEPTVHGLDDLLLTDKHVLVVDDVFATGCTMKYVVEQVQKMNPKSVKSLVLLSKKRSRHFSFEPDYSLFEVGSAFVVGFGIDHEDKYRGLPGVYCLTEPF